MHVPGVVVGVGDLRPVDLDEARAGLDQPAGQQTALAEGVHAVLLAQLLRLLVQVEGVARPAGDDQAQRLAIVVVEAVFLGRLLDVRHPLVDEVAELAAALQTHRRHFLPQLEVVGRDAVHLVHVHVVAGRVERVRVVGPAEEAGRAALADDVALLQSAAASSRTAASAPSGGLSRMICEPTFGKSLGLGGSSWPDGLTLSAV